MESMLCLDGFPIDLSMDYQSVSIQTLLVEPSYRTMVRSYFRFGTWKLYHGTYYDFMFISSSITLNHIMEDVLFISTFDFRWNRYQASTEITAKCR